MTRTEGIYPRRSATTHTESLGDEASVYDWAQKQVHALNPTAAAVWRLCDGATGADAIARFLQQEKGIPQAEAIVDLTLKELAGLGLLELPVESLEARPARTRRWLLERGLAAAMLPAVYSILTPTPLEAQSIFPPPTLVVIEPLEGVQGATLNVVMGGTNFVVGQTTVNFGLDVDVNLVQVPAPLIMLVNITIKPAAALGPRQVTVTTPGGPSPPGGPDTIFTVKTSF